MNNVLFSVVSPIKAIWHSTYFTDFTTTIGREKNGKIILNFLFFQYRFSSETAINQWRYFFSFLKTSELLVEAVCRNLIIVPANQISIVGINLPADLFFGCLWCLQTSKIRIDWSVSPIIDTVNWKFRNPLLKCVLLCKKFKSSFV